MAHLLKNKPRLNLKGMSHYCGSYFITEELTQCYPEFEINKGYARCRICPAGSSSSILVANLSKHLKTAGHQKQQAVIAKRLVPPPASSVSAPSCSVQDDATPQGQLQISISNHLYLPSFQMMGPRLHLICRSRITLCPLQGLRKTAAMVLILFPR